MEEMKSRYVRILIGFIILMVISTFTIKNHVKNVSNVKQTQEVLQAIDAASNNVAETSSNTSEIQQVRIAQEPSQETPDDANASDDMTQGQNNEFEKEGLRKMGEGNLDDAIMYLEKAFDKGDIEAKKSAANYLVQCYEQKGEIAGIINVYDRLLQNVENDVERMEINNKLAGYFLQMGNKEQALSYYEDNYNLNPTSENFTIVADILLEANNKDKLSDYIRDYMSRYPDDQTTLSKYLEWINSQNNQE